MSGVVSCPSLSCNLSSESSQSLKQMHISMLSSFMQLLLSSSTLVPAFSSHFAVLESKLKDYNKKAWKDGHRYATMPSQSARDWPARDDRMIPTMRPYRARASAKMRMRIIPTNSFGCCALALKITTRGHHGNFGCTTL
uniref:Uncharacterized protein n=1 Tax=Nelumbo nucifera TaxID=4432 RepID=A0A822Y0M3_NELNU|nr:TPA_asm: hypothetical protein HUJ06_026089 [Nelumbo nucifera]